MVFEVEKLCLCLFREHSPNGIPKGFALWSPLESAAGGFFKMREAPDVSVGGLAFPLSSSPASSNGTGETI